MKLTRKAHLKRLCESMRESCAVCRYHPKSSDENNSNLLWTTLLLPATPSVPPNFDDRSPSSPLLPPSLPLLPPPDWVWVTLDSTPHRSFLLQAASSRSSLTLHQSTLKKVHNDSFICFVLKEAHVCSWRAPLNHNSMNCVLSHLRLHSSEEPSALTIQICSL